MRPSVGNHNMQWLELVAECGDIICPACGSTTLTEGNGGTDPGMNTGFMDYICHDCGCEFQVEMEMTGFFITSEHKANPDKWEE